MYDDLMKNKCLIGLNFIMYIATRAHQNVEYGGLTVLGGEDQSDRFLLRLIYCNRHGLNFVKMNLLIGILFRNSFICIFLFYRIYTPFTTQTDDTWTLVWESFANAFIVLGVVVVMTIVLILLYKFRCYKVYTISF